MRTSKSNIQPRLEDEREHSSDISESGDEKRNDSEDGDGFTTAAENSPDVSTQATPSIIPDSRKRVASKSGTMSSTTGRAKWTKKKKEEKSELDAAQISFFNTVEKALNEKDDDSKQIDAANEIFGKFVACELKQLSAKYQRIAKHQIENILFEMQMNSERMGEDQRQNPVQISTFLPRQQLQPQSYTSLLSSMSQTPFQQDILAAMSVPQYHRKERDGENSSMNSNVNEVSF